MISCILPTFNRCAKAPRLLEESIFSFIRQSYPDKELLIINDCPGQTLVCNHPQIRVFNLPMRFPSLGEKYNFGAQQAKGEFLCTWEDDDISLTNRLANSIKFIGSYDYYNPKGYWFYSGRLHWDHPVGYAHNCSLFRKDAFLAVGGYPKVSGPQDAQMDGLLRGRGRVSPHHTVGKPREWDFIYRWGVSDLHLSAFSDTDKVYRDAGNHTFKQGVFNLSPRWQVDYEEMVRNCIEKHAL